MGDFINSLNIASTAYNTRKIRGTLEVSKAEQRQAEALAKLPPPPPAPPPPPRARVGVADEILKLAALRDAGEITVEQYESLKARLLLDL